MDLRLLQPSVIKIKETDKFIYNRRGGQTSEEVYEYLTYLVKLKFGEFALFDKTNLGVRLHNCYRSLIHNKFAQFPDLNGRKFKSVSLIELDKFLVIRVK